MAIVGGGPSHTAAPFRVPGWEIWSLPWLRRIPRADLWFEVHHRSHFAGSDLGVDYIDRLAALGDRVVILHPAEDLPQARIFDLAGMRALAGGLDYRESSAAYMAAQAILERVDALAVFGFELHNLDEYVDQKPNLEFWIGIAIGRGIPVYVPDSSSLLRHAWPYGEADP